MHVGPIDGAVYARREDVVLREVAGEQLLVPIKNDVAGIHALFALAGIGVFVWGLLDGERALDSILALVLERYDVTREEAEADVANFIARLSEAGLVERRR